MVFLLGMTFVIILLIIPILLVQHWILLDLIVQRISDGHGHQDVLGKTICLDTLQHHQIRAMSSL